MSFTLAELDLIDILFDGSIHMQVIRQLACRLLVTSQQACCAIDFTSLERCVGSILTIAPFCASNEQTILMTVPASVVTNNSKQVSAQFDEFLDKNQPLKNRFSFVASDMMRLVEEEQKEPNIGHDLECRETF